MVIILICLLGATAVTYLMLLQERTKRQAAERLINPLLELCSCGHAPGMHYPRGVTEVSLRHCRGTGSCPCLLPRDEATQAATRRRAAITKVHLPLEGIQDNLRDNSGYPQR